MVEERSNPVFCMVHIARRCLADEDDAPTISSFTENSAKRAFLGTLNRGEMDHLIHFRSLQLHVRYVVPSSQFLPPSKNIRSLLINLPKPLKTDRVIFPRSTENPIDMSHLIHISSSHFHLSIPLQQTYSSTCSNKCAVSSVHPSIKAPPSMTLATFPLSPKILTLGHLHPLRISLASSKSVTSIFT